MENDFYSPVAPKNNTLATVSLALSLAGLPFLCAAIVFTICGCATGLLAIGAVVTGFIARQQIKSTGEQGDTRALIGMIVGGIQVLIVACAVLFSLALLVISLITGGLEGIQGAIPALK